MTGTWPAACLDGGLGVEYKFIKQLSVAAGWSAESDSHEGSKRSIDGVTVGVHYYF